MQAEDRTVTSYLWRSERLSNLHLFYKHTHTETHKGALCLLKLANTSSVGLVHPLLCSLTNKTATWCLFTQFPNRDFPQIINLFYLYIFFIIAYAKVQLHQTAHQQQWVNMQICLAQRQNEAFYVPIITVKCRESSGKGFVLAIK